MLRKLLKNKKAQNTAEYALMIAMVVAAIVAITTYVQRTLQARVRDASQYLVKQTNFDSSSNSAQYEPYYLSSSYNVTRDEATTERQDNTTVGMDTSSNRSRDIGGFQESSYNATGLVNGI